MSGIDPLAAITARVAAAEAAMLEAAINLGVSAEVVQAQISTGDILPAIILAPQNGQDVIEILGQRVTAQLPPGVHPGETLLLQVTGFSGSQIFVRNLGTPDPRNPLPVSNIVLIAPESADTQPQSQPQQAQIPAQQAQPQQAQPSPVSPPREVFVAASVRQAPPVQAPPVQGQSTPAPAAFVQGVEARIAAAQAAKIPPVTTPAAQSAPPPQPSPAPLIPSRAAAAQTLAANAVQRAVQTVSEFLRAARLPDTPFTRMAATIAPQAPERLPSVLQRLDAALPRVSDDPRISTLRTLIGFTARLNPANAETLPAQISAYVSNVIEGVEAKLAQLLQAHTQTAAPQAAAPQTAASPQAQKPLEVAQGTALQSEAAPNDPQTLSPTVAQARVAERTAAISHDLKSVVLSLLRDPPASRTTAMTQALSETLITLTGVQVNALAANQQNPGTLNFALPVYYREGGKPAQVRISRDAQSRGAKMDADNFHVAFVLDTANLGTVAIDLQTTGRTVKVEVKTENTPAAERFADTLSTLRGRLEDLRYRVASAVASALPKPAPPQTRNGTVSGNASRADKKRGVDLQA
ncbi:MAG TPA: flagellar hook-length control protein FliK [Candidatus Baltobacteraceae bacterium]|nr:flagellar hook-length control protein FliK [Candidatus Baltobacteraceae bacterium]